MCLCKDTILKAIHNVRLSARFVFVTYLTGIAGQPTLLHKMSGGYRTK